MKEILRKISAEICLVSFGVFVSCLFAIYVFNSASSKRILRDDIVKNHGVCSVQYIEFMYGGGYNLSSIEKHVGICKKIEDTSKSGGIKDE